MAIKKSELYSSLWKSCDELRGGMDASQYKDYILTLLFVKYVTDKSKVDEDFLIEVPEGGSFDDMVKAKGKANIGEEIDKVIAKLAEENDLKGVIDVASFNDSEKIGKGKEMVDKLTNLINIFQDQKINFGSNKAEGDDLLGDAYEYLMRNFATESGKSKGQFYTPAEVSRVLSKVMGIDKITEGSITVYDPTCGSGSLLVKVADEAKCNVTIYGQEMDNATAALAKMNMIMHSKETAEIWQDNTLSSPYFKDENDGSKLKRFNYVVANPPFSTKSWSNGVDVEAETYERFKGFGTPPDKNGDYAFMLHIIKSLNSNYGKAAVILPHGVLFRGNAEEEIRRNIIKKGLIKGIIGLPANLFYGTGIPACIIVIDKENAASRKGIFMIDASKGFIKDGNKNRLRDQDIHKIVDVFEKQLEIPKYSRMVPMKEVAEDNEYNLNIPRYIDSSEAEDIQDISAHLLGGIPNRDIEKLEEYWKVYPTLKKVLFSDGDREGYSTLNIEENDIKDTIFNYHEFTSHQEKVHNVFNEWIEKNKDYLLTISEESKPKDIIKKISEDILESFKSVELISEYDVYQGLMSYWNEVMHDDTYLIVLDGWKIGNEIEWTYKETKKKDGTIVKSKEPVDYEGRLIPKELLINKYFKEDKEVIEDLEVNKEEIVGSQEELLEEHGGEEGLLVEVISDNKISKANLTKRIKEIKSLPDYKEELEVLNKYLSLLDEASKVDKKIKDIKAELDKKIIKKYSELSVEEIKDIVVNEKWMDILTNNIEELLEGISQNLNSSINDLVKRYEDTMTKLDEEFKCLEGKVEEHLKRMGYRW
ncbi:MAG: type I restriction-modification system subunit M [Clostridium sp.]